MNSNKQKPINQGSFDTKAGLAERHANQLLATWCEYGTEDCQLAPEYFPTPRHTKLASIIIEATAEGERGWAEIMPRFLNDDSLRQSFISAVQDQLTTPRGGKRLVEALRAFYFEKRKTEIAQRISSQIEAGQCVDAELAELAELNALRGEMKSETIAARLAERAFSHEQQPEKPVPLYELAGNPICTAGNLTNVQALPKAGKSAVTEAQIAAAINGNKQGADTLSFTASNEKGLALIHFDTEQSRYDSDALVRRCLRRANMTEPPAWLYSYSIADLGIEERREALRFVMQEADKKHGGIFAVMIDGIGDLCRDPNDSDEAFNLVHELHAASITYDCTIVTVLHENPGSEKGKTRGHLGSQLERKAETNLRLAKDKDGITTIWAERARHCYLPKDKGPCFAWNDEKKMHASCGTAGEIRQAALIEKMQDEAELVFGDAEGLSHTDLTGAIMEALSLKDRAAKGRISKWHAEGIIRKASTGKYYINQ